MVEMTIRKDILSFLNEEEVKQTMIGTLMKIQDGLIYFYEENTGIHHLIPQSCLIHDMCKEFTLKPDTKSIDSELKAFLNRKNPISDKSIA